ncbi:hypothetical protein AB2B38_007530 [Balneola sp. MJW-20]|uniref:hypothetical protein n=1 Tax=Gracilimonas aurantiaca TaxID=3234185 RepID=UPI003467CC2F
MKTLKLLVLLLLPISLSAQVIDDSSIDRINRGEVEFMQGEFVAYLADTTSPSYALEELSRRGFEVSQTYFRPVTITILNFPPAEILQQMRSDKDLTKVTQLSSPVNMGNMLDSLKEEGLSELEISRALKAIQQETAGGTYQIELDYSFTKETAVQKMKIYPGIAWELAGDSPRMVNIKAEPGNEEAVMLKAEEVPFVKYTALIGMLKE